MLSIALVSPSVMGLMPYILLSTTGRLNNPITFILRRLSPQERPRFNTSLLKLFLHVGAGEENNQK